MAAFDNKAKTYKYGDYPIDRLLALDPRNAPPAPLPGAGASEGVFGSPAPVGGSPAFAPPGAREATDQVVAQQMGNPEAFVTGPKPNSPPGAWEATSDLIDDQFGGKANKPFFELWREGSEEEKKAIADQVEEGFKAQNVSMKEQAEKLAQSNPAAMELAEKFGYVPPKDKAGKPPFKTQGEAFVDAKNKKDKPKWDREAWGGFLMEAGLRILASNKQDAGGAIGEGVLGTMDARRQRAEQERLRKIQMEELERQRRRDKAADERAEERLDLERDREGRLVSQEDRLNKATEARIRQINHNISAGNFDMVQDKDGKYHVVKTDQPGLLRDAEGNPIEGETAADMSRAQLETWQRQITRDRADLYKQVRKELEGFPMDPAVEAIQNADPKDRKKLIDQVVEERLRRIYQGGISRPPSDELDYNDMD